MKTVAINRRDKTKTDRASKVHKDWYKLDLSAIVYPTLQRRDFSSVYRLSVLLKEEIDPEMLQRAVNLTMPRFPTYKAAIRKGVFWRYLEPNDRPGPFVQEDVKNPCQPMYFKANNRYLVRIYYYRNRIALEAHHSLGDGTGGMCVLQTLTATYLRLKGHTEIENGGFEIERDGGFSMNHDLMLSANQKIGDFNLEGIVGGTLYYYQDDTLQGLDAETKEKVATVIKMQTAGKTVLFVTHDEKEAEFFEAECMELV
mgnify:CR=1 FL=1